MGEAGGLRQVVAGLRRDVRFIRRQFDADVRAGQALPGRVVVYTGIVGPYDELPLIRRPDPAVDYVCFSDQRLHRAPWTVVPVRFSLVDPKLVVGYLKSQAVELFPLHAASCWVDARFTMLRLSAREVRGLTADGSIRTARHPTRSDPFEELEAVTAIGLDDPAALLRTSRFLEAHSSRYGRPELPTGNLVLRNHTAPSVRAMGRWWWSLILSLSRRDQLTFGAAIQLSGARWMPLDRHISDYVERTRHHADASTRTAGPHAARDHRGYPRVDPPGH